MKGQFGREVVTFVPLAAAAGLALALVWLWTGKRGRNKFSKVGTVSGITLHPVKSMQGVRLHEARCTWTGLATTDGAFRDRHFVVTMKDYSAVTMRSDPKMALMSANINGKILHIDAECKETLQVSTDIREPVCTVTLYGESVQAVDCGEEAASWLQSYLGRGGLRLCYSRPEHSRRPLRERKGKYQPFLQDSKPQDQIAFNDISPFMMMSDASLEDLNARLEKPVSMRNFRPSITFGECAPFEEDEWQEICIGQARFSFVKFCNRCLLTQVDQDEGKRREDGEPLTTLRKYRLKEPRFGDSPCLGTDWILEHPGTIKLGDAVYACRK